MFNEPAPQRRTGHRGMSWSRRSLMIANHEATSMTISNSRFDGDAGHEVFDFRGTPASAGVQGCYSAARLT